MQIHKYLGQFQWYLEHIADIKEESATLEQRATLDGAERKLRKLVEGFGRVTLN